MFRALTCPSSGGPVVYTQHLVSTLSVNGCTVHRLRAEISTGVLCSRLQGASIPDAVCTIGPPEDGHVNARNMSRMVV